MELHFQANMREHLDITCVKIGETQVELKITQETTRKLEKKLEAVQRQLDLARVKRDSSTQAQLFQQRFQFDEIHFYHR